MSKKSNFSFSFSCIHLDNHSDEDDHQSERKPSKKARLKQEAKIRKAQKKIDILDRLERGEIIRKSLRNYTHITFTIPIDMQVTFELNWAYICEMFNPNILRMKEVVRYYRHKEYSDNEIVAVKKLELDFDRDICLTIIIDIVENKNAGFYKGEKKPANYRPEGYFYMKKKALRHNDIVNQKLNGKKLKVVYKAGEYIHDSCASSAKLEIWGTGSEISEVFGIEMNHYN